MLERAEDTGHLLMELPQAPVDYAQLYEYSMHRPSGVDWAYDTIHRLAARIVEDSLGAERFGRGAMVRWATHMAMDEIRTVSKPNPLKP